MIKMQVTRSKTLRYPSGDNAREYKQGDYFEALSERDAKALTLIRAAKRVDQPATIQTQAMKAEPAAPVADAPTEHAAPRRQYRRRDMRPEE